MKNRVLKLLLISALLNFNSCEKDFIPDEQKGAERMVINALLDSNRDIEIFVTESVSPNASSKINPLTDAVVELYMNDSLLQMLPFVYTDSAQTFGGYKYYGHPRPENRYTVKVSHPKYGTATAEDIFPILPVINNYQLLQYGDSASYYTSSFRFQFQDMGDEENFYRLNAWQWGERKYVSANGDTIYENYGFSCRPELTTQVVDTVRDSGWYLLFNDKSFNGQNKQMDLAFRTIDSSTVLSINLVVELCQISRAHYEYFRTLEQYQNFNNGESGNRVYSNVNNGYGIFMGQAVSNMYITVK